MMRNTAALCLLILLASCGLQKRHYRSGFYVQWQGQGHHESGHNQKRSITLPEVDVNADPDRSLVVSASNQNTFKPVITPGISKYLGLGPDSCDVILLSNGSEIQATILEVNPTEIKYKKCRMPDGPMFVTRKADVFRVTYKDGTKEVFQNKVIPNSVRQTPVPRVRKNTKLATKALIFSLLGLYPFIFLFGIVGSILATIHLQRIRKYPDSYGGEKKAKVAQWLGFVTTIIGASILALIFIDAGF
jgi:hypothetical protein